MAWKRQTPLFGQRLIVLSLVLCASSLQAQSLSFCGESSLQLRIAEGEGGLGGDLTSGDLFGFSCANLGDLDGDGIDELIVGAPGADDGSISTGALWVLFLQLDGTVRAEQKISNTAGGLSTVLPNSSAFGRSLVALGDADGDGRLELLAGAPEAGLGQDGLLLLLELDAGGMVTEERLIGAGLGGFTGTLSPQDQFGRSIALIGDLDGNGVGDLLVGADGDDSAGINAGACWVLFLDSSGLVMDQAKITEGVGGFSGDLEKDDCFGASVAGLGDFDRDGFLEVVVGAPGDDTVGCRNGAIYVLSLEGDGTVRDHFLVTTGFAGFHTTLRPASFFGASLLAPGDLNGDGTVDLLVGAYNLQLGMATGSVFVFHLQQQGDFIRSYSTIHRDAPAILNDLGNDLFGASLALGPTLPGRNGSNVLVGATSYPGEPGSTGGAVGSLWLLGLGSNDPDIDFDAPTRTGPAPLSVAFQDATKGADIIRWDWEFGDGSVSSEQSPTHTYAQEGTFNVALTVTSAAGKCRLEYDAFVVAGMPLLAANFSATPLNGMAPLSVLFRDTSAGVPTQWSWDFGDGLTSIVQDPNHTYTTTGLFSVSLTVTGGSRSSTQTQECLINITDGSATTVSFNGGGTNPDVLTSADRPLLGSTFVADVDGTSLSATGLSLLVGFQKSLTPGSFLSQGELLIDPSSTLILIASSSFQGNAAKHVLAVPLDFNLVGFRVSLQAFLGSVGPAGVLTNRLDTTLGTF